MHISTDIVKHYIFYAYWYIVNSAEFCYTVSWHFWCKIWLIQENSVHLAALVPCWYTCSTRNPTCHVWLLINYAVLKKYLLESKNLWGYLPYWWKWISYNSYLQKNTGKYIFIFVFIFLKFLILLLLPWLLI